MKAVLLILGILFVIVLVVIGFFYRLGKPVNATLSDAYYHHAWKSKIVYAPMGNWFELGYIELEADPTFFTVLSKEFAKDGTTIFWKGKIQAVQYTSFTIDAHRIPKDATHVYYDFDYGDSLLIIESADPESYEPFQLNKDLYYYRWARDRNGVFLNGKKIDVDRASFTLLNKTLAADTTSLYSIVSNPRKVMGDPESTKVIKKAAKPRGEHKVIGDNYLQIDNTLVLSNWKTEFAMVVFDQINSIRVLDERNIVVNASVLVSDGERIDGIDIASFEVLNRDFMKDKNNVFTIERK